MSQLSQQGMEQSYFACSTFLCFKGKLKSEQERYRKVSGEVSKILLDNAEQEMKEK